MNRVKSLIIIHCSRKMFENFLWVFSISRRKKLLTLRKGHTKHHCFTYSIQNIIHALRKQLNCSYNFKHCVIIVWHFFLMFYKLLLMDTKFLYNDYYKSRIFVHVLSFKVRHHQRKTYQMNFKMHIICKIAASIIQGVC